MARGCLPTVDGGRRTNAYAVSIVGGAGGYGIWIRPSEGRACSYAMVGEDPGVAFSSTYDPSSVVLCSLLGNTVDATWAMLGAITPDPIGGRMRVDADRDVAAERQPS